MTDAQLQELQQRNLQRAKEKIAEMGSRYLCHPANRVTRQQHQSNLNRTYAKIC